MNSTVLPSRDPLIERRRRMRKLEHVAIVCALLAWACSGKQDRVAQPEAPPPASLGPTSEKLGAARDTHYTADIEAQRGRIRVIVREESVCDVIPIQSVVENGKKRQVAGDPTGTRPCEQRVTRNGIVSLEVDGNTYRLGEPNQRGEVQANLSNQVLQSLYGDDLNNAPVAEVMIRDRTGKSTSLGTVTLTQLSQSTQRLEELLAEFRAVLDRPQEDLQGAELARAYELYEQLARFDSNDPRIQALQALFLERLYNRKATEANQRFERNLEALNAAKDILMANRTTVILPGYVTSVLNGGSLDERTVNWARGEVAMAIRRNPTLCGPDGSEGFTWSRLQLSPPPPQSRLAFEVLRFAYDNPYQAEISALCRRLLL